MRLGVLKEIDGENRVSIVPGSIKKLKKMGFEVVVESGSGAISHNSDSDLSLIHISEPTRPY